MMLREYTSAPTGVDKSLFDDGSFCFIFDRCFLGATGLMKDCFIDLDLCFEYENRMLISEHSQDDIYCSSTHLALSNLLDC